MHTGDALWVTMFDMKYHVAYAVRLCIPCICICSMTMLKALMEAGADPTVQDDEGRGGLEIAEFYKSEDVLEYFSQEKDGPFSRNILQRK